MADLIDRQKIIEQLELFAKQADPFSQGVILGVVYTIKCAPAVDAVEVVRCKDCKFSSLMPGTKSLYLCSEMYSGCVADGFCNSGKRREENAAD